jgi:DNA-binding MarR family transcriptional regulator
VSEAGKDSDSVTGYGPPLTRVLAQAERQLSRRLDPTLSTEGLTVDQWRVLDLLADDLGHPMSEIAGTIVVPGPTLTKLVDRLIDHAMVYRLVDSVDRRRVLVFLSDRGREVHRGLRPEVERVEAEALADLGEDAGVLRELLGRIVAR